MKKLVVLTGAGVSAESGISTFRDNGGLWDNFDPNEVASIEGWHKNPALMLDFYNIRRRKLANVKPNAAHLAIADLQNKYDVNVITQNVDNLHERAGSSKVLHLHGNLPRCVRKTAATRATASLRPVFSISDTVKFIWATWLPTDTSSALISYGSASLFQRLKGPLTSSQRLISF